MTGKRKPPRLRRSNTPPPPRVSRPPEEPQFARPAPLGVTPPTHDEDEYEHTPSASPPAVVERYVEESEPADAELGEHQVSESGRPAEDETSPPGEEEESFEQPSAPPAEITEEPAPVSVPPSSRTRSDDAATAETEHAAPAARRGVSRLVTIAILVAAAVAVVLFVRSRLSRARDVDQALSIVEARHAAPPAPSSPLPVTNAPPQTPEAVTGDDASVVDRAAARAERDQAVLALEKKDVARALDAAEHAVMDEPEEAEGWLILGAVHLYRGDYVASQRAFKACVTTATYGRKDHCAALLH